MNLDEMELSDLKKLQRDVARAIEGYQDRRRKEALNRLEAQAQEMGFSLNELTGSAPKKSRSLSPAKYRDPKDPSRTWTGRGRQPNWIKEALAEGYSLEDMKI